MLTGKTRHRIGFKGKLVLQVEEKLSMPLVWGIGGDSQTWRDATIEDLQELVGVIPVTSDKPNVPQPEPIS